MVGLRFHHSKYLQFSSVKTSQLNGQNRDSEALRQLQRKRA